jgi:hypothetical protein
LTQADIAIRNPEALLSLRMILHFTGDLAGGLVSALAPTAPASRGLAPGRLGFAWMASLCTSGVNGVASLACKRASSTPQHLRPKL